VRSGRDCGRLRRLAVVLCGVLSLPGGAASGEEGVPTAVDIVNASKPTLCAEEDNVYVKLVGEGVAAFRIEARHPDYIDDLRVDSTAPDFAGCDMSSDPAYAFTPRSLVLFEDADLRLVGHTFTSFWRPNVVPFRVAERTEHGLHLIQVFLKAGAGATEFLVLYPADGYWRLRPLPPRHLSESAYGSSFLVGPVAQEGRPLVAIDDVLFEPATRSFHLTFTGGGRGSLAIAAIRDDGAAVDVRLDPPADDTAFAALRSMFVRTEVADAAEVLWQPVAGDPFSRSAIMAFGTERAVAARFGRSTPSRHNTSAPDLLFHAFIAAPAMAKER
jgi:hypothetical protein